MLKQILREFQNSGGFIDLADLSRRLGVELRALDGMLEMLVRQGKLREISQESTTGRCHCGGVCSGCGHSCPTGGFGKSYEVVLSVLPD